MKKFLFIIVSLVIFFSCLSGSGSTGHSYSDTVWKPEIAILSDTSGHITTYHVFNNLATCEPLDSSLHIKYLIFVDKVGDKMIKAVKNNKQIGESVLIRYYAFASYPGNNYDSLTLILSKAIKHNEDYTIDISSFSGLFYYVIREPLDEPVKHKWVNTLTNYGNIPDIVFDSVVETSNYRYYITKGLQSFSPQNGLELEQ